MVLGRLLSMTRAGRASFSFQRYFMRLFTFSVLFSAFALSASAQLTGNGYYRASSTAYGRYITVIDNRTNGANYQTSSVDLQALRTTRPFNGRVDSDPATVLYFSYQGNTGSGDAQYDLKAQGVDTYKLVQAHLIIKENADGTYWAYGSQVKAGTTWTLYLLDEQNQYKDVGNLVTANSAAKKWLITPISAASDNYFGVKPTVNIDDKWYATLYADFPFQTYSSGMKVYYIDAIKDGAGVDYAELKEITGIVPANTPVIIECSSSEATDNRLELIYDETAAPRGNILKGVYFENIDAYGTGVNSGHQNSLTYNASTMRVLAKVDGALGFRTSKTLSYIPANSAYLPVPEGWDDKVLCLSAAEYASAIQSVEADDDASSAIYNLMGQKVLNADAPGIYIIGGKKVIRK